MWFEKEEQKIIFRNEEKNNVVRCEECGCLVDKNVAQAVIISALYGTCTNYYCKVHKLPYEEASYFPECETRYFRKVAVDKEGTPIGYEKTKHKNTKKQNR